MLTRELGELREEEGKISRHADDMVDARSSLTARSSALHLELDALMLKLKTVDDDIDDHTQRLLVLWEQREEAKTKRQAKETEIQKNETDYQNTVDKVNGRFMADTEGVRNRISNHKRNLAALKGRHPEAFVEDNREQSTESAQAAEWL